MNIPSSLFQGVCSNCNTSSLTLIDKQFYCQICKIYTTQDELVPEQRFVPQNYRPNFEKRLTSKELRVISLYKNLIDYYKVCGENEIRLLNEQFLSYKAQKRKCQSYEAITAAIFFYTYRDLLYRTMKDFAEENGIDRQQFNRCFMEYSDKKQKQRPITTEESFQEQTIEMVLTRCKDFFKLIRNDIFAGTPMKNLHDVITNVIMQKIELYLTTEKEIIPIVCLVYKALKQYQYKISLKKYAEICKKYGKVTSPATIAKYSKIEKKSQKSEKEKETEKSVSIEDQIVLI